MDNFEIENDSHSPLSNIACEIPGLTETSAPITVTAEGGREINPTPDTPNGGSFRDTFMALRNDAPPDASRSGVDLLNALWRSPDRAHQIGTFDRQIRVFKNQPVQDGAQAVARAKALSDAGVETYFACAEFQSGENRKAENTLGAWGFWMDLDCGDDKSRAGKGYLLKEWAFEELTKFCNEAGIPEPTHIVSSGGGLHAYWVVDRFVPREIWQKYGRKLKALADRWGLRADATRTADIASVLRIPGMLNHKYQPPKPVVLHYAAADPIELYSLLVAIDTEYQLICGTATTSPLAGAESPIGTELPHGAKRRDSRAPDMAELSYALAVLDPDCDEATWALKRIAPMARAAREHPELHDELHMLARHWSCGNLGGIRSRAWVVPGGNGLIGKQYFEILWRRFLAETPPENAYTLRTIYFDAAKVRFFEPGERSDALTTETGVVE